MFLFCSRIRPAIGYGAYAMTEEITNLVLEHLRDIRPRVDNLQGDMRQVILRLGSIERHVAELNISDVKQNSEINRIKQRLDRLERRFEVTDG
jgi:tetrahydromethanopterin S-methyltransferase subunit G